MKQQSRMSISAPSFKILWRGRCVGEFFQHPMDYGHTKTVQHEIPLVDSKPFRLPYRKIPPSLWQEVRKLLIEMEAAGVIRPSKSPYASPVVVVTK